MVGFPERRSVATKLPTPILVHDVALAASRKEPWMLIIGYGEDGLTAWAVTHRLADILKALDDPTAPSDCMVVFRPSFGRAHGQRISNML